MSESGNGGRGLSVVLGMILVFCGLTAMGTPFLTGTLITVMMGGLLVLGGVMEMVLAFSNGWKAGLPIFFAGVLAVMGGVVIWKHPVLGSSVFTLLMVGYFMADGISRGIQAFKIKPERGWGFMLFGGMVSVLLGIMLWQGWPLSGLMAIGILVGVRMLFTGVSLLAVGFPVKTEA
jgi:uncharacterized membrane protein HdeD (DUF308 family)